jgi:hypothetical protein
MRRRGVFSAGFGWSTAILAARSTHVSERSLAILQAPALISIWVAHF